MPIDKSNNKKLKTAASDAIKIIKIASDAAAKSIVDAAEDATKLLAKNAEIAAGVVKQNNKDDHDLLTEVRVKIDDLKTDIKDLKDGTTKRIGDLEVNKLNTQDSYPIMYKPGVEAKLLDHEIRMRTNEKALTQVATWGTALILFLSIAQFLVGKFVK